MMSPARSQLPPTTQRHKRFAELLFNGSGAPQVVTLIVGLSGLGGRRTRYAQLYLQKLEPGCGRHPGEHERGQKSLPQVRTHGMSQPTGTERRVLPVPVLGRSDQGNQYAWHRQGQHRFSTKESWIYAPGRASAAPSIGRSVA
jgi:hypothetical protein